MQQSETCPLWQRKVQGSASPLVMIGLFSPSEEVLLFRIEPITNPESTDVEGRNITYYLFHTALRLGMDGNLLSLDGPLLVCPLGASPPCFNSFERMFVLRHRCVYVGYEALNTSRRVGFVVLRLEWRWSRLRSWE